MMSGDGFLIMVSVFFNPVNDSYTYRGGYNPPPFFIVYYTLLQDRFIVAAYLSRFFRPL